MIFESDPNLGVLGQVAILVALVAPELRAASSRAYRRVFPFDALRIGAGAIGYVVIVVGLAVLRPGWLLVPTLIALGVIAYLAWRARPSFGVADRLPPGSLERLPIRPWSDPEFYKTQAARYGNVFKMSQFGQPMICIVGLERANRLLLQHDEQLVAPPLPFSRFIEGGYLRYLPEETHAKYRKFFRTLFYSDVIKNAESRVSAAFARGFDAMCAQSAASGSVRVREATMRMMFAAWGELFYGIDDQHADFARLKALYHVIDIRRARWASKARIDPVLAEIEAILRRRASELARDDSPPWCFLSSLARTHPEALNDRTILGNLIYTMQVTWGDVTGLLLWVFKMLSDHPDWRQRLAQEPSRELATRIVQETLRLEQSESRYRRATADLEIDEFRIPKTWLVRVCVRESHQDETIFPNATAFNPDRFIGRPHTRGEYAPFGAFRLACIGEDLTKTVAAIYALELVTRFDWRVVKDGPAEISSWAHNAPNKRLAVAMTPRAGTT
jgi:cytochrome P450